MKYKVRYTFVVCLITVVLGWAIFYEIQHPPKVTIASPVIRRTLQQLIAPRSIPKMATSTTPNPGATSTPSSQGTSTFPILPIKLPRATSTSSNNPPQSTSTSGGGHHRRGS